jgi:hypothetical protein
LRKQWHYHVVHPAAALNCGESEKLGRRGFMGLMKQAFFLVFPSVFFFLGGAWSGLEVFRSI